MTGCRNLIANSRGQAWKRLAPACLAEQLKSNYQPSEYQLCAYSSSCPCLLMVLKVALFDVAKKTMLWRTSGGHTETIFDCAFSPQDCNLLATCSFDGSICLWNLQSLQCEMTMKGNDAVLYSLSWSPDGNRLAASDSKGCTQLFDIRKGQNTRNIQVQSKQDKTFHVAWNPDPAKDLLASASASGVCTVFSSTGSVQRVLRHGTSLRGVGWNELEPNLLATSCEKGVICVWDMDLPPSNCLFTTLTGHRWTGSHWLGST